MRSQLAPASRLLGMTSWGAYPVSICYRSSKVFRRRWLQKEWNCRSLGFARDDKV